MPSPVGHALGGLIVGLALAPLSISTQNEEGRTSQPRGLQALLQRARVPRDAAAMLLLCAAAACLPDIDFLWGRHNMETHSVGFAVLLGALVLAWRRPPRVAAACVLAAMTHPLLDWLGSDDSPPLGVMALWPWTRQFFYADVWLFDAISRRYWRDDFVAQNVMAILRELLILVPLLVALVMVRQWWHARRSLAEPKVSSRQ